MKRMRLGDYPTCFLAGHDVAPASLLFLVPQGSHCSPKVTSWGTLTSARGHRWVSMIAAFREQSLCAKPNLTNREKNTSRFHKAPMFECPNTSTCMMHAAG